MFGNETASLIGLLRVALTFWKTLIFLIGFSHWRSFHGYLRRCIAEEKPDIQTLAGGFEVGEHGLKRGRSSWLVLKNAFGWSFWASPKVAVGSRPLSFGSIVNTKMDHLEDQKVRLNFQSSNSKIFLSKGVVGL